MEGYIKLYLYIQIYAMAKSKHSTFRFEDEIIAEFKQETDNNYVGMTETLEGFMKVYVKLSKEKRNGKG